MTVLAAIIVFLLLVDVAIATRIVATRSPSPASTSAPQGATGHPCNHGDDGKCTAPLPASGQAGSSGGSDEQSGSSGGSDD